MHMLMPKKHGFTVVELLVVIVVIGILAAITIISYLWLTKDAQVAHMTVSLSQYSRSLDMYKSKFGGFPTSSNSCIGSYPAITGSPLNACYSVNGGSSYTVNASVNTELQKVGLQPTVFTNPVTYTSGSSTYIFRGLRYYSANGSSYTLYWYLQGDQDCGIPSPTYRYYYSAQDYTYCYNTVS